MACITDRNYDVPRMTGRVLDLAQITITKQADTQMIGLLLNLDEKYRKAAAKKAAKIFGAAN